VGHWVECLVYKGGDRNPLLPSLKAARLVHLKHGFVAVPIDQKLLDEFRASYKTVGTQEDAIWGEIEPDPVPTSLLEAIAQHHLIAYIRTRYFGGDGEQVAGIWENGQIVMGPLISATPGPINAALKKMGVPLDAGAVDEFDSLGLGRYRSVEDFK